MASTPAPKPGDLWLWLAANEEQLLLHSGLMRLADHIPVPSGVTEVVASDRGLPVMDGKRPPDLANIILRECGTKTTTYASLMEYRRNALRGYWSAVRLNQKEETTTSKESSNSTRGSSSSSGSTTGSTSASAGFASRVSLVLIFPIMKSLSRFDPTLSSEAASGLLECLRVYEPLSLSGEKLDCVHGLESLLHSWLTGARGTQEGEGVEEQAKIGVTQVQNAASALVALSVAVGTGSLLVRTVHALQSLQSTYPDLTLLVPGILSKLLHEHLNNDDTACLTPNTHLGCWNYEDSAAGGRASQGGGRDGAGRRSIAFDGKFLYVTSAALTSRLLKIGSGKHGTIRGYVYCSQEVQPGWLVWANGRLLHRPLKEKDDKIFCHELDPMTLKACCSLSLSVPLPEGATVLYLLSDSLFLYALYHTRAQDGLANPVTGDKIKQYPVFVQQLQMKTTSGSTSDDSPPVLVPTSEPVLLQRGALERDKNSEVVKALVRANPSYASSAAAFATLFGSSKDDTSGATSVGLTMRVLQSCSAYTTGSSLVLIVPPSTSGGRGLFGPSAAKALCVSVSFNVVTGMAVSQSELMPSPSLHCALAKGATVNNMAACYDPINHCVWTSNDDWVDVWDCYSKARPAVHLLATRLGKPSTQDLIPDTNTSQKTVEVSEAIKLLLRHIGIESCRLSPGAEMKGVVSHSLPLSFLEQSCDLLAWALATGDWDNCQALVVTLLAVLPAFLKRGSLKTKIGPYRERVRALAWDLLTTASCPTSLHSETRKLISFNVEELFLNHENADHFIQTLHQADSSQPGLLALKDELLVQTASKLRLTTSLSPAVLRLCPLLEDSVVSDSLAVVSQCLQTPLHQLANSSSICSGHPAFSPSLQCAASLLNISLRILTHAAEEEEEEKMEEGEGEREKGEEDGNVKEKKSSGEKTVVSLKTAQETLLRLCTSFDIFRACQKTLAALCSGLDRELARAEEERGEEEEEEGEWVPVVERALKSTVVGGLLIPLLVVIGDRRVCTLTMANLLQKSLHPLVQLVAQLCGLLYGGSEKLSTIKVPCPWATGRTIETIHPVRDNYKFKETVSFPGARNLYLKFDSRCSSQYDYDKVIVYSGDSTSAPKVAEYGGNTHGFGSRSVLGKGWPKDIVKVEGDVVTFTFDMKSGREHSTPDQAMWGFACTVRPQETSEDNSASLPFPVDVYLSLVSVSCSLIGSLYHGPPTTEEEKQCLHLTDSELLQRCEWKLSEGALDTLSVDGDQMAIPPPPPHSPLPPVVINRLRTLAKKPRPQFRPSTRDLLQPDLLEDVIVSVCLKQHGLESALELLGHSTSTTSSTGIDSSGSEEVEEHSSLLDAVFTRINGLERRIQVLAELEKNWWTDVEDITRGSMSPADAFFFSLLQHETSLQNFELLCCLKNVDTSQGDIFTSARQLQDIMELDVEKRRSLASTGSTPDPTPVTRQLVAGVMERARLLLSVTIARGHTPSLASYTSTDGESSTAGGDQEESGSIAPMLAYVRSFSGPPITAEYAVRRQRSGVSVSRSRQALLEISSCPDKSNLLHQIFMFIGSKPEKAVSPECFLAAANQQWRRGVWRMRALRYLYQLLSSDHVTVLAVEHLLASVGLVIQSGPGVKDIACGGMAQQVREAFAGVMHAVVELASKQPSKCINTIAMLCVVPYTRLEETCLVRSGLVKLLDRLCSQVSTITPIEVGREEDEEEHRVTSLAWAAFQVLADRCVSWESQEATVASSGLAQQVAMLLTNHLSRAMDSLVLSETGASEALQDALSLLLGLARSLMGRAILSQPTCVSKLLLLLTDQRPSPKLVLIALQLCRIALPLMTLAECSKVVVPPHPPLPSPSQGAGLAADIVQLLLAKLAEYIVPQSTEVLVKPSERGGKLTPVDSDPSSLLSAVPSGLDKEADESGQASVYIYKRANETSAEILQPLISQDSRQLRLSGPRMQEVILIDRALSEHGRAEMFTDNYRSCQRRALRWASMGFVVSIEPPSGSSGEEPGINVDKKRAKAEAAAKKKNLELLKRDPPRPFLSGQVAYSLASEVIGLLHGLVTVPGAAEVWSTAIKEALLKSLCSVPELAPKLVSFSDQTHRSVASGTPPPSPGELLQTTCIANATFAAFGGFKESIRPGMRVKVVGDGLEESCGVIQSIAERRGVASVQFSDDEFCFGPDKSLDVPLSRLLPPQKEMLPLNQLQIGAELCSAVCAVLKTTPPSISHAHSSTDANNVSLGLCRLFAEMRSRACIALLCHVQQSPEFLRQFMSTGCWEDLRNQLTSDSGLRLSVVESHCLSLRMLYRDCARPPAPRIERPRSDPKVISLDVTREWPLVSFCAFSHNLTSLSYQGPSTALLPPSSSSSSTPASGEGSTEVIAQPKGVMLFANTPIPDYAPSFYWELEMGHIGDSSSDTAQVAMGYSPAPEKPANGQPWNYPIDAVFIRSSGRGCQVRGANLMEWVTMRLTAPLRSSDVVGCGWVREGEEEGGKGNVYFTLNGQRTENSFTDAPPEMIPFLHIQKKALRVRVNFGDRPFVYGEGHAHRNAADVQKGDSAEEMAAAFMVLPFAEEISEGEEEKREEGGGGEEGEGDEGTVVDLSQTGPKMMKTAIATVGYDAAASQMYQLGSCYDNMLECGPLIRPGGSGQEEQSEEEATSTPQEEDLHALLVKAWETKVFPVIQRRFRNDQERKSGLEQIKGALQLGMEGIAQETVEFLYEENGGAPKDLHLPTMDDVKADLGKFTISKVHKSMAVVVQKDLPYTRCGVRSMQKTQGLTGIVLDIDESNELVQVECYLQSEGALVRFWFPVVYLEKPPPGYRKSPTFRGADAANIMVYRELLNCEASLCSMNCRRALLSLGLPASPAVGPALDHLQLVAADSLSEPLMEGGTTTTCPDLAPSTLAPLSHLTSSPLALFYSQPSRVLSELSAILHNFSLEVEGVGARLCQVLTTSPQGFTSAEVRVAEARETLDIGHSDAAFLLLDCRDEKGAQPPPSATFKYPWARGLCYKGGLGKNGQQQLQEVVRYPSEVTSQYCGPTYPSLVLPFCRIHLKTGGCSVRPLKKLHVLSIPADLPLALAFADTLCSHSLAVFKENPASLGTLRATQTLSATLDGLTRFLARLEMPQILKERSLLLLSQILWTLCCVSPTSLSTSPLSPDLLQGLKQEAVGLYETEVGRFSKAKNKTSYPPPGSISEGGQGKFSTYFQALLETLLATSAYSLKFHGVDSDTPFVPPSSPSTSANSLSSSSPSSSSGGLTPGPESPGATAAPATPSKKSGMRRFRGRVPRGAAAKKDSSESDKKKKVEWVTVIRNASLVLTSLTPLPGHADSSVISLPQSDGEAALAGSLPIHPASRLVVVTGIPTDLPATQTRESLHRACRSFGGLHNDRLYLPVRGVSPSMEKGEEGEQIVPSLANNSQPSAHNDSEQSAQQTTENSPSSEDKLPPQGSTEELVGHSVLELNCSGNTSAVCDSILNLQFFLKGSRGEGEGREKTSLAVMTVSDSLTVGEDETGAKALEEYLRVCLTGRGGGGGGEMLFASAREALKCVFESRNKESERSAREQGSTCGGQLSLFLTGFGGGKEGGADSVWRDIESSVKREKEDEEEGRGVSCEEFLQWCTQEAARNPRQLWLGLFSCGYDLHFTRCGYESSSAPAHQTTLAQDRALVLHVDSLCRHFSSTSSSLQPWDLHLSESSLSDPRLSPLQGVPLADLRLRLIQLKYINHQLALLLPVADLRSAHPLSLGCRLSRLAPLLFYDVKMSFLHGVLNASTRRSLDQAPPEIKMDPLESLTGVAGVALETQFCKAASQMLSVPSPQLCVPLASGGDPTYAFNVKLAGEEVHGTSGSFRHFVWQAVRELQSSVLPILLPCPSGATGLNSGKYILCPGQMSYSEEKLLQFFGQLVGVAIRADVPIALDLLPCFWKSLKGEPLSLADLRDADCITFHLTEKMLSCSAIEEFDELLAGLVRHPSQQQEGEAGGGVVYHTHHQPSQQGGVQFVYHTMTGEEVELCPDGHHKPLTFENRREFVEAVRALRLRELSCDHRVTSVRCGLASVVPLQLLNILTPTDLDLRVCGIPDINLDYLRRHTKYHVGLEETDKHVQFFWNTLESFSQEELRKFIKFACNQERIPFGNPCREGGRDTAMNVPPYPMKIAPPDGTGPPDSRYIRAETCMFLLKLPQYSTQEIMTSRLRYAIHCMEDPLSG